MAGSNIALSEQDFETIEAAVMETARGRWFLAEYARRHRSADTAAVLEAIGQLETRLAPPAAALPSLAPVLEALRRGRQEVAGLEPLAESDTGEAHVALAERLKDLAWSLRETGADDEACEVIERSAGEIGEVEARLRGATRRAGLASGILDMLLARLEELDRGSAASVGMLHAGALHDPADASPAEAPEQGAAAGEHEPAARAPDEPAFGVLVPDEPAFRPGPLSGSGAAEETRTAQNAPLRIIQPWQPPPRTALPLLALPAPDTLQETTSAPEPRLAPYAMPADAAFVPEAISATGEAPPAEVADMAAVDPASAEVATAPALRSDIVLPASLPRLQKAAARQGFRRSGAVSLADIEALSFEEKAALFS